MRQLRRLGASCDWSRERFTLDEGLSAAVRKVFVTLHKQGLIYRDKRLVNWDPQLQTAISDLEVEQREVDGAHVALRYPLEGERGPHIVVATTRPETMLGDTAVAVHPDDERYKDLVGKQVRLPIVGRLIPIIADDYADPEKGTGAVKITPAHDFNDFHVGQRHDLPVINILDPDARLNDEVAGDLPRPRPLRRAQEDRRRPRGARPAATASRPTRMMVPLRRAVELVVIEPYLTDQWYVDAKTLAAAGDPGGRGGPHRLRAEDLGEDLLRVDAQHRALVRLAPALVGPPHPGLVRAGRARSSSRRPRKRRGPPRAPTTAATSR